MLARMSANDDQSKALRVEMDSAKSVDAKRDSITKLQNLLIEQRSTMRMQMETQGTMLEQMMSMHQMMQHIISGSPDGSATPPQGAKNPR
jgi:hypothetical protein